ncbi:MAG: hypothetical protein DMG71_20890 [Acidobacteria bacterium]|nr:MAG: hypothetical protein DMG71_20890 [Acidobacteriota bacterium]
MKNVAYIANQFPSAVEPYVWEEICQLRSRGIAVIATSARRPNAAELTADLREIAEQTLFLQPMRWWLLLRAAGAGRKKRVAGQANSRVAAHLAGRLLRATLTKTWR